MTTGSRSTEVFAGLIITGIVFGLLSLWGSAPETGELIHATGVVQKVLPKGTNDDMYIWLREDGGHVVVLAVYESSKENNEAVSRIQPGNQLDALYCDTYSSRHGSFETWSIHGSGREILSMADKVEKTTRTVNFLQTTGLLFVVLGVLGLIVWKVAIPKRTS